ncbi:hypothetical protein EUC41_09160 [Achromobacter denitrificans]|uniref:hypothetical protein n=1 Tax=Achromobacter denitrificans TaxID=32002 RepID=UPI00240DB137|nr:hypothetical protein [Achromobacter denitrificans]WFC66380.1 hypothetical protein EUC41_08645 [Achromobacter denitrificans]WFC66468.1 hypothetical protein EUC41_09160 [Achromobacter denitrificans]
MTENNAAQPVLTDDEIKAIRDRLGGGFLGPVPFARAIESALLSKLRAPVDERAAFEAIVKRLGGDCTWRPGYGYVSSMTRLYQNFWRQIHAEQGNRNDE